jgi:hypothetical protein
MQVIVANYQLLLAVQCQIEEFCQSSLGCATQSREHAVPDPSQRTNHQSHFIHIDQKQALVHDFLMFPTGKQSLAALAESNIYEIAEKIHKYHFKVNHCVSSTQTKQTSQK